MLSRLRQLTQQVAQYREARREVREVCRRGKHFEEPEELEDLAAFLDSTDSSFLRHRLLKNIKGPKISEPRERLARYVVSRLPVQDIDSRTGRVLAKNTPGGLLGLLERADLSNKQLAQIGQEVERRLNDRLWGAEYPRFELQPIVEFLVRLENRGHLKGVSDKLTTYAFQEVPEAIAKGGRADRLSIERHHRVVAEALTLRGEIPEEEFFELAKILDRPGLSTTGRGWRELLAHPDAPPQFLADFLNSQSSKIGTRLYWEEEVKKVLGRPEAFQNSKVTSAAKNSTKLPAARER